MLPQIKVDELYGTCNGEKKKDGEERDIKYCCALELEANYLLYFWIAQFVKFLYTQENLWKKWIFFLLCYYRLGWF